MKKAILLLTFALLALGLSAQTGSKSMTDEEVLAFVIKERQAGTEQTKIVTKLIQNGVDIAQIRRVKEKYQGKGGSAGNVVGSINVDRSRMNNGTGKAGSKKTDSNLNLPEGMTTDQMTMVGTSGIDMVSPMSMFDMSMYGNILDDFEPDSLAMLRVILQAQNEKKVFGRDIFNNEEMTFEPNMNIATPKDYRLGPGDAVFIEIYGASQRTIEGTVSPDGEVTIEGYGPIQLNGLTVSQANAKLRSTIGQRYASSRINLTVGQTRTIMVNVMGEVNYPGTYTLSAFASVFHALYMAGGVNDIGTLRDIKVYRNNRLVSTIDIYDYILNGQLKGNVLLADNDVITVGAYD